MNRFILWCLPILLFGGFTLAQSMSSSFYPGTDTFGGGTIPGPQVCVSDEGSASAPLLPLVLVAIQEFLETPVLGG